MRRWRRSWLLALAAVLGGGGPALLVPGGDSPGPGEPPCLPPGAGALSLSLSGAGKLPGPLPPPGTPWGGCSLPLLRWGFRLPACCGGTVLLGASGGLPRRGPGYLPAAGPGAAHPKPGRQGFGVLRQPGGGLPGHLCGRRPAGGTPPWGWALFFSVTGSSLLLGVLSGAGPAPAAPGRPLPRLRPRGAAPLFQAVRGRLRRPGVPWGGWVLLFGAASPPCSRERSACGTWPPASWGAGGPALPPGRPERAGFSLGGHRRGGDSRPGWGLRGRCSPLAWPLGGCVSTCRSSPCFPPPSPGGWGRFFLFRLLPRPGGGGAVPAAPAPVLGGGRHRRVDLSGGGAPQAEAFFRHLAGRVVPGAAVRGLPAAHRQERGKRRDCAAGGDVLQ